MLFKDLLFRPGLTSALYGMAEEVAAADADLGREPEALAHPTSREEVVLAARTLALAGLLDEPAEPLEEAPRLRRQLVERAAGDLVGEAVASSRVRMYLRPASL